MGFRVWTLVVGRRKDSWTEDTEAPTVGASMHFINESV